MALRSLSQRLAGIQQILGNDQPQEYTGSDGQAYTFDLREADIHFSYDAAGNIPPIDPRLARVMNRQAP